MPRTRIEAAVLGTLDIRVDGSTVPSCAWSRHDARQLVELLLVTPGHRLRRAAAIDALWPEREPEAGRSALRKALHFARRALGDATLLEADRETVGFAAGILRLDLDRLTAAIETVSSAPIAQADDVAAWRTTGSPVLEAARVVARLGLRELLADEPYAEWTQQARTDLWMAVHRSLLVASRQLLLAGEPAQALDVVDAVLAREPSDEAAHRLAIEIYVAEGRHDAARQQLERCREVLRTELGIEPSPATVAALGPGRPRRPPGSTPKDRWLVGRDAERRRFEDALAMAAAGRCTAVTLLGPVGIGKTRLLRELADTARTLGWRVLEWHAADRWTPAPNTPVHALFATEVDPVEVAGWDEPARSAAAALVPGLELDAPLAFTDRAVLAAGVRAAIVRLARARPLLLAWDDLPMLDTASLEVLGAIIAEAAAAPLLVVGTVRDDEPVPHAVSRLRDVIARDGGVEIHLGPLDPDSIEALVISHMGGQGLQASLRDTLFKTSEGNPLFCLDLVRTWIGDGSVERRGGCWIPVPGAIATTVPPAVSRLVAARSAHLSAEAGDLLAVIAELPAIVPPEVLSTTLPAGRDQVAGALQETIVRGLLVEHQDGYAYAHPLFREAVREAFGAARRGWACLRIACAWGHVDDVDDIDAVLDAAEACRDPVAVAEKALEALRLGEPGARLMAAAFGFAAGARGAPYWAAGGAAGFARAAGVLEGALHAWDGLPPDAAGRLDATRALVQHGERLVLDGDEERGMHQLLRATRVARTPDELALAHVAAAAVPVRHGDLAAAMGMLEAALAVLPDGAAVPRAHIQREIGSILLHTAGPEAALPRVAACLEVFDAADEPGGRMRSLVVLAAIQAASGRACRAIALLEQALALARELGDPEVEVTCRLHLARTLAVAGQLAKAREHVVGALELSRGARDRFAEAVALGEEATIEDLAGKPATAGARRRDELRLLEECSGNPLEQAWALAHLSLLGRRAGDIAGAERDAVRVRDLVAGSTASADTVRIERALAEQQWAAAILP